MAMMMYHSR